MAHKKLDDSEELHHLYEIVGKVDYIPGRREAKRIESEYIKAYKEKNGRRPRGNLKD